MEYYIMWSFHMKNIIIVKNDIMLGRALRYINLDNCLIISIYNDHLHNILNLYYPETLLGCRKKVKIDVLRRNNIESINNN